MKTKWQRWSNISPERVTARCCVSVRITSKPCSNCLMLTRKQRRFVPRFRVVAIRQIFLITCGFRFTVVSLQAGFSAEWVKWLLAERDGKDLRVLDPFVGSGTTCLACDEMGVPSYGIEAHPFVYRVAQAKLSYTADPDQLISKAERAFAFARKAKRGRNTTRKSSGSVTELETLEYLDRFRQAVEVEQDGSPEAGLLWMALFHRCALFRSGHSAVAVCIAGPAQDRAAVA